MRKLKFWLYFKKTGPQTWRTRWWVYAVTGMHAEFTIIVEDEKDAVSR